MKKSERVILPMSSQGQKLGEQIQAVPR